jgi:hypothetical protein
LKNYNIEIQRVKGMSYSHGLIQAQIDALVQPASARDEGAPTTVLGFSEETARVLMLLLKAQLAELDSRKAKSRR